MSIRMPRPCTASLLAMTAMYLAIKPGGSAFNHAVDRELTWNRWTEPRHSRGAVTPAADAWLRV